MLTVRSQAGWLRNVHLKANKTPRPHPAGGFTVVELMISMVIMLLVALAMVQISANVFRTNSEAVHMAQLSQELRSVIQLISRDIRRAGYNDDSLAGFLATQDISSGVTMGDLDANDVASCLRIQYEDLDGVARNAVYRLRVVSEIGRVSAHFGADASCDTAADDSGWVDISDPLLSDISTVEFVHQDHLTDIAENLSNGHMIQVGLEQISILVGATLRSNTAVTRSIRNEVQIRNNYLKV
jgi:Tfp pilus assembly protein PilW